MRFERAAGPRTRLLVVTEGMLGRLLHADPFLDGVGVARLRRVPRAPSGRRPRPGDGAAGAAAGAPRSAAGGDVGDARRRPAGDLPRRRRSLTSRARRRRHRCATWNEHRPRPRPAMAAWRARQALAAPPAACWRFSTAPAIDDVGAVRGASGVGAVRRRLRRAGEATAAARHGARARRRSCRSTATCRRRPGRRAAPAGGGGGCAADQRRRDLAHRRRVTAVIDSGLAPARASTRARPRPPRARAHLPRRRRAARGPRRPRRARPLPAPVERQRAARPAAARAAGGPRASTSPARRCSCAPGASATAAFPLARGAAAGRAGAGAERRCGCSAPWTTVGSRADGKTMARLPLPPRLARLLLDAHRGGARRDRRAGRRAARGARPVPAAARGGSGWRVRAAAAPSLVPPCSTPTRWRAPSGCSPSPAIVARA